MIEFRKYQHVERLGNSSLEGLLDGPVEIFPKLDGTNASVWLDEYGVIQAGSRKRILTLDNDNAGFLAYAREDPGLKQYLKISGDGRRLYGEWLIPHTFRGYEPTAWKKFYVFDVGVDQGCTHCNSTRRQHDYGCAPCNGTGTITHLIPYDNYVRGLQLDGVEVIPRMAKLLRPTEVEIRALAETPSYLVADGKPGEGLVIKRYDFRDKWGRQTWGKVVRETQKHPTTARVSNEGIEIELASAVLPSMVEKVYANIVSVHEGWESQYITQLLQTVWYDFFSEELWDMLKKHRNPVIDFRALRKAVDARTRAIKPEVFS